MECQRRGCARVRTSFRHWTASAAILLMAQFFAVAGPLQGQEPSRKASNAFENLQRSLDVAVGEQLRLVSRPGPPMATTVPGATDEARPGGRAASFKPEGNSTSGRMLSAERRFQLMGVDAGRVFREEGVPVTLLRIAQVESNWKPFALSPKGAFGLWQLMPVTARRYGLRVDAMGDDRADADKSTRAAARYLRDLHLRFGDWALTLAAYNAGEDAVQRAIDRGASRDFWNLSGRKLLPAETRAYVPAVLAVIDPFGAERTLVLGPKADGKFVASRIVYAAARQIHAVDSESKGRM
jgi:hypothetical protein